MADEEIPTETGSDPSQIAPEQGPLVAVTFQKNLQSKLKKYLEAEPKALGVTEIVLSVFHFSCASVMFGNDLTFKYVTIARMIMSVLMVIAGILAIAAQNLHLPTLKACLGMQIVVCALCIFNVCFFTVTVGESGTALSMYCWEFTYGEFNGTNQVVSTCHSLTEAIHLYSYEDLLINVALLAISATLAAYCCKVDNCCTSTSRMPVITVQAPPAQH